MKSIDAISDELTLVEQAVKYRRAELLITMLCLLSFQKVHRIFFSPGGLGIISGTISDSDCLARPCMMSYSEHDIT